VKQCPRTRVGRDGAGALLIESARNLDERSDLVEILAETREIRA
jgi:hypothetical protein